MHNQNIPCTIIPSPLPNNGFHVIGNNNHHIMLGIWFGVCDSAVLCCMYCRDITWGGSKGWVVGMLENKRGSLRL